MKEHNNTDQNNNKDEKRRVSLHILLPIILLVAIVGVLVTSVTKFSIWNRGITIEQPDEDATFPPVDDSEDYFVYYTPEEFSQIHSDYVDDGELNIVVLGDESIIDYGDGTGIVEQISAGLPDANIYSICFPNSQISPKNYPYDQSYANDAISLYWLSVCIAGDNYDFQTYSWPDIDIIDTVAEDSLDVMQTLDFSTVDVCIINYNAKEYLAGEPIESIDREDHSMYANAIYLSLELLENAYPHMQFIVASPTYCLVEEDGEMLGSEITNTGYGFLPTYMIAALNAATQTGNSFMDNILGVPINKDTYTDYLEDDGFTLNELGRTTIANRYIGLLSQED